MTETAKLFTILIIFSGITVVGYGVTSLVASVFEGEWKAAWRRKRMSAKIQELRDHYIVCGAGDVGGTVIKSLVEKKADFIVIEENEERVEELEKAGVLTIRGDATHEDVLLRAGIRAAKGIVCTLATDSENVFTVLTARQMTSRSTSSPRRWSLPRTTSSSRPARTTPFLPARSGASASRRC
jgi:voltage-gated potassium channel